MISLHAQGIYPAAGRMFGTALGCNSDLSLISFKVQAARLSALEWNFQH